jgi:hypothetical protein
MMLADAASVAPLGITVGADKNYDTAGFVASCRANCVTPHVAQNDGRPGGSAIDERTTRWPGYAVSQQKRKRIEQVFGWGKTVKLLLATRGDGHFRPAGCKTTRHFSANASTGSGDQDNLVLNSLAHDITSLDIFKADSAYAG